VEKNIPKRELAAIFLRLGLTSFGGPVAHIAMMEEEFVRRKRWVTPEKFLDLVAAANLIPGPSSSELAIYIGQMLAGVPGLLIAGLCFIFPASLLAVTLAWVYVRFGSLPEFSRILYGIKPVMIAIIIHAIL
jgi:chromate transporter